VPLADLSICSKARTRAGAYSISSSALACNVSYCAAASLARSLAQVGNIRTSSSNIRPLLSAIWERHLLTYQNFPPLQAPESYNLGQVLAEVNKAGHGSDRELTETRTT